jgi:hypothetical protein
MNSDKSNQPPSEEERVRLREERKVRRAFAAADKRSYVQAMPDWEHHVRLGDDSDMVSITHQKKSLSVQFIHRHKHMKPHSFECA